MAGRLMVVLMSLVASLGMTAKEAVDSVPQLVAAVDSILERQEAVYVADSVADAQVHSSTYWIKQLVDNGFHINDPGVAYPAFPRFCLKVYNWGDRTFNSYDPEYVVGSGKNWKLFGKSYNWFQTYQFAFDGGDRLNLRSDIYADMGAYLCFMAVSVGYMWNVNEWFGGSTGSRTNFNLNFTCALFTIDYTHQSTDGGAQITEFATNVADLEHNVPFNDIHTTSTYFTGYYFFNHRRYSHAAAYCFSKYQLKSAGSWLAGFSWVKQNIKMDFESLVQSSGFDTSGSPDVPLRYHFNYSDYMAQGGYGYNWVLKPRRWLFNVTTLAGLGVRHSRELTESNRANTMAFDLSMRLSLVYNHRALFAGVQAYAFWSYYHEHSYDFFNTNISFQALVGMRF